MGGLTSIFGGLILLAFAVWSYISGGGFDTTVLALLVGAAVLFWHGVQGRGVTQAGDIIAPMEFVKNPAEAIVDAAVERVSAAVPQRRKSWDVEEPAKFDADAALAHYMANRPADLPAPPPTESAPPSFDPAPRRGFGRKGL